MADLKCDVSCRDGFYKLFILVPRSGCVRLENVVFTNVSMGALLHVIVLRDFKVTLSYVNVCNGITF